MVVTMTLSETIVGAAMYMYIVAFCGSMGILTAAWIGYKIYKRQERKQGGIKRKRGMA